MKKVFSMLALLLLCFSIPVKVSASAISFTSVQKPYYETAGEAISELSVNGTTATCKSSVRGKTDVVKITAVQTLEKQGFLWIWSTFENTEWTKTVYSNMLTMSNTKTGLSSGKYRVKTVFTLTDKNGKTETVTVCSSEEEV